MTANDEKLFLQTLDNNEDYAKRVSQIRSEADLIAVLNEIGISISQEEASDTMAQIREKMENPELTEEMLDAVNGGCILAAVALGVGCGIALGVVLILIRYSLKTFWF